MNFRIAVLPGDGIGPEVVHEALRVLRAVTERSDCSLDYEEAVIGGAAIDLTGSPLPMETLAVCSSADAILLGAVGGPRWDDPAARVRPEQGLLGLRKALGLFANLRPVRPLAALAAASPVRSEVTRDVDLLVVRELTGGLYFGEQRRGSGPDGEYAVDTCLYTTAEIERVVRLAAQMARARRGKLTSVDKANVLETSRLWRQVTTRVVQSEFPDLQLDHVLVDACAMHLILSPRSFDVIVTENLFGDILTDEASVLAGSIGLLPSASLGDRLNRAGMPVGLYEPIHGSAPALAGRGVANPIGAILSVALLLRYSLGMEEQAAAIEAAVRVALEHGAWTPDLGEHAGARASSTTEVGRAVIAQLVAPEVAERAVT